MRAVVYDRYGDEPTLRDLPDPGCPEDGAVIEVRATGVCRSDWHAWRGHDPVSLPQVPGHEFAGVVLEVGSQVRRVRVGDRVTAPFVCGCGRCDLCLAGDAQVCRAQYQPGFSGPGSYAERVAVPGADTNVVVLPDSVGYVDAAALGCRVATAFRAVHAHAGVTSGDWLVVWGCGGVGLSALLVGRALGVRVIAVDVSVAARDRALELGAEVVLDGADPDAAAAQVLRLTDGGAHAGIDAVGVPALAAASVASLRPRGRHVQVGLLLGEAARTALPMDLVVSRELEVRGSHGMAAVDYPALLRLITEGRLDPAALVGRVIGLEAAGAALAQMDDPAPAAGITVVTPTET